MARKKKSQKRPQRQGINYRTFNNRVVECSLSDVSGSYYEFLSSLITPGNKGRNAQLCPRFSCLADEYRGLAYCNADAGEVFDEEKGKQIAKDRCMAAYYKDFDHKIVELLEELHTIEARLFNRLRKADKLSVYFKAKDVDEIYDTQFAMKGQSSYLDILTECPEFWEGLDEEVWDDSEECNPIPVSN